MKKLLLAAAFAAVALGCTRTGEDEYQVRTPEVDVDIREDTHTIRTPDVRIERDTQQVVVPRVRTDP